MPEEPISEADGTFYLWPCNLRTWQLWHAVQTQWMVSMSGPTGLSYPGVMVVLCHHIKNRRQQKQRFFELQAMEKEALDAWDEKREKDRDKA